jgi:nucleoside triphosphate pyrophosphatase
MSKPRIVLASASPRRQEILRSLGIPFRVVIPDIVEEWPARLAATKVATRLALEKTNAADYPNDLVVAMDTVVAIGNLKLGKPGDSADAVRMLRKLSGRPHRVITGVAMKYRDAGVVDHEETRVEFKRLSQEEIQWYVSTGEPFDKAGGYAIQGYGKLFIRSIHGCYFNVVGFPIHCFIRCLNKFGFSIFDFMRQSYNG